MDNTQAIKQEITHAVVEAAKGMVFARSAEEEDIVSIQRKIVHWTA